MTSPFVFQSDSVCEGGSLTKELRRKNPINSVHQLVKCARVMYNRVPKCGSRTMLSTMRELSVQNNFTLYDEKRTTKLDYLSTVHEQVSIHRY